MHNSYIAVIVNDVVLHNNILVFLDRLADYNLDIFLVRVAFVGSSWQRITIFYAVADKSDVTKVEFVEVIYPSRGVAPGRIELSPSEFF